MSLFRPLAVMLSALALVVCCLQARDCYMFHATEDRVIDNTGGGNYARFTNHCCRCGKQPFGV